MSALLTAAGIAGFGVNGFWRWIGADVSAIGSLVSYQAAPALSSGDREATTRILSRLGADSFIRDALLYDSAGACFAAFHRSSTGGCQPRTAGQRDGSQGLTLRLTVPPEGPPAGTLLLMAGPSPLAAAVKVYGAFLPWIMALGLGVTLITFPNDDSGGRISGHTCTSGRGE